MMMMIMSIKFSDKIVIFGVIAMFLQRKKLKPYKMYKAHEAIYFRSQDCDANLCGNILV